MPRDIPKPPLLCRLSGRNGGQFTAIQRSNRLVRGYRWHILWVVLIFFVSTALLERIIGGVFQYLSAEVSLIFEAEQRADMISTMAALILNQAVFGMLGGLAAAYSFLHLRRLKDGRTGAELADIFE